jgi:hypothetical protein
MTGFSFHGLTIDFARQSKRGINPGTDRQQKARSAAVQF